MPIFKVPRPHYTFARHLKRTVPLCLAPGNNGGIILDQLILSTTCSPACARALIRLLIPRDLSQSLKLRKGFGKITVLALNLRVNLIFDYRNQHTTMSLSVQRHVEYHCWRAQQCCFRPTTTARSTFQPATADGSQIDVLLRTVEPRAREGQFMDKARIVKTPNSFSPPGGLAMTGILNAKGTAGQAGSDTARGYAKRADEPLALPGFLSHP